MKKLSLLLVASSLLATPAWAAKKKLSKDPAHAEAWVADPKTYEGKKVTTSVVAVGDIGMISTASKYAVIPVVTGTSGGISGDTVNVLVATTKAEAFVKSLEPKRVKGGGAFGSKTAYTAITGTFLILQGEPALVIDEVKPEVKAVKPSALLAKQLDPKQTQGEVITEEKSAGKAPDAKPKDAKKTVR